MRPARAGALVCLALLPALACKRTVAGEESRWTRNTQTVKELAVVYPGFKGALEARHTEAKAIYDTAQGISDEKQRVEKLTSANNLLGGGFVQELEQVDGRIKGIRAKLVDLAGATKDEAEQRRIDQARQNAERGLAEIATRLRQGASDGTTADVLVRKIAGDLRAIEDQLAKATPQKPAASTTSSSSSGASSTQPTSPPPAAVDAKWTCSYCNHVNDADAKKCSNCGAAREK